MLKAIKRDEQEMKDSGIKWVQDIPKSWDVQKLKYILTERKEKNDPIITTDILSLTAEQGVIPYAERQGGGNKPKEDLTAYKVVRKGDIVLNSMNILSGAVNYSEYTGCVSPVYYTLYHENDIVVRYYNLIFQTEAFQKSLRGLGNGILIKESSNGKLNTIRMRIPMEKLGKELLPVPSIKEMQDIVSEVEPICSKIDTIIAEAKASIEEYKELKQAVVYDAVTKGLDKHAEMKNSNVEWIGDIPFNWKINVLFQLITQVKNKNENMIEQNLLSLSYGKIKRKNINSNEGLLPESFENYNIVEKDDIVLRLTDLQNDHKSLRVGRVNERGIITSAYVTLHPNTFIKAEYLYYVLHTFDLKKGFYGMGSGVRQGLTYNEVKMLKICYPPLDEQQIIVHYLDNRCEKIDTMISEKESLIEDLESYKKSLIYEVVTGKRKVVD